MSFRVNLATTTSIDMELERPAESAAPQFVVHECGFAPIVDDWTSRGEVRSPFWCMWHALDCGQWVESDGVHWDLGPERLVLVPAQVVYTAHSCRPMPQLWLHFSLVPDYAFEATSPFEIPLNALLREQIAALISVFDTARENDTHVFYHYAVALLNNCFAYQPLPLRALPDALLEVLQMIESMPAEDLSNARLARSVGQSVSTFIRWFEAHMQQSPAAYVRHVRYQQASRMLIFSEASIEQIAAKLGYPNRHYFSRAFARHAGCGPATFRKNRSR